MPDKLELERRVPSKKAHSKRVPDPSLPSTAPKSSLKSPDDPSVEPKKNVMDYFYNRETKEYCGRTCTSWMQIIGYGVIYLLFLSTYTLTILYISLFIVKRGTTFKPFEPLTSPLIYPVTRIGLTAIPPSETNSPLIWYRKEQKSDYDKYIQVIEKFLLGDNNITDVDKLGPCGRPPYGYGDKPCVLIKINKHFTWKAKALQMNSSVTDPVSPAVMKFMMTKKNKLWLECNGCHSYDKEHIGSIKYYPDPPAFDPALFPIEKSRKPPVMAIQISDFTVGISLAIECKLWYEGGPSLVNFVLYVAPNDSIAYTGQTDFND